MMLVIRDAQLKVLADDRERAFREELADRLQRLREAPADERRRLVEHGIPIARAHGLTLATTIADFVGLMHQLGHTFHQHPKVRAILAEETLAPDQRIDALYARLMPDDWRELQAAAPHGDAPAAGKD